MADGIDLTGEMIVAGVPVRGTAGTVAGVDPRTGESLSPEYGLASADDVDRAASAAWEAFASYRETTSPERAAFLRRVADEIEGVGEAIVERVTLETGIPTARVRGELARTTGQLRLFATVLTRGTWQGARVDTALPDRTPLPRPDLRQRKIPLGPVAVFSASNFPLAFSVAGGDTASALAAGCPVIVKAHSAHPGTSELVGRAVTRAVEACGLHPGVFSLVFGDGSSAGVGLVGHPHVRAVGFTGSRSGGLALLKVAQTRPEPIPFYGEMSSVNPVFLLPHALESRAEATADAFVDSLTVGAGQLCTNPGLVFAVRGPALNAFLGRAAERVRDTGAQPMLSSGIAASYDRGAEFLRVHAKVTELASGQRDDGISFGGAAHLFTTDGASFLADAGLQGEVFGATSLVVQAADVDELTALLGAVESQLTVTIHADPADHDLAAVLLAAAELKAGRIVFNGWPTGVEVCDAMVHGGPFPATSDGRSTSVGTLAIERFLRPVAYQSCPPELLPPVLDTDNSTDAWRLVDGEPGRS